MRTVLRWLYEVLPLVVGAWVFLAALGSLSDGPILPGWARLLVTLLWG